MRLKPLVKRWSMRKNSRSTIFGRLCPAPFRRLLLLTMLRQSGRQVSIFLVGRRCRTEVYFGACMYRQRTVARASDAS